MAGTGWWAQSGSAKRRSRRWFRALAYRSSVEILTSSAPASRRATADCDVPIRAATTVWESPSATRVALSCEVRPLRAAISEKPGKLVGCRRSLGSTSRPRGRSAPSIADMISRERYMRS